MTVAPGYRENAKPPYGVPVSFHEIPASPDSRTIKRSRKLIDHPRRQHPRPRLIARPGPAALAGAAADHGRPAPGSHADGVVRQEEVLAIFATAPVVDADELRADLEDSVGEGLRDPYEGTGL
jgi:hypothetical protein